mgnify:FL=1
MFSREEILARMDALLEDWKAAHTLEFLDEVAMKRVVRNGKIVRKVKVKRNGFKVVRRGNTVKFVRMTQKEKRARRKAARKAWRVGKAARKQKAKRTMIRSKVRMKTLYGK